MVQLSAIQEGLDLESLFVDRHIRQRTCHHKSGLLLDLFLGQKDQE